MDHGTTFTFLLLCAKGSRNAFRPTSVSNFRYSFQLSYFYM